jgi:hypothetical protein
VIGLSGVDAWVFRLAGAGCLGYATAGIACLMAPGYRLMRIQNVAAITFNLLGAIRSWIAGWRPSAPPDGRPVPGAAGAAQRPGTTFDPRSRYGFRAEVLA